MPYYSFSPNERFTFICLDGTTDKSDLPHGQIEDKKQMEWLKNELEANKDKYVIITLHFPLIEPYHSEEHTFFLEPDRTRLLNLINSYKNIVGVFAGHYHAAKLLTLNNIIHNSCPALVQYPNAFREIIITEEGPGHIKVNFTWHEVNALKLIRESRHETRMWNTLDGNENDREQAIELFNK